MKGHKVSEETKRKISQGQKLAHKEGRNKGWIKAYGKAQSFPEEWFLQVIRNEFLDQNFKVNLPVHPYFLDFAWPEKMRYIEIDGKQHDYPGQKEYDQRRDDKLSQLGWKALRIKWIDFCYDSKHLIQIAKKFIEEGKIVPYLKRWRSKKELYEEQLDLKYGKERSGDFWRTLPESRIAERIKIIREFKKGRGWKTACAKQLGITHTTLKRFIEKYEPKLSELAAQGVEYSEKDNDRGPR